MVKSFTIKPFRQNTSVYITDRWTSCHSIVCIVHMCCTVKINKFDEKFSQYSRENADSIPLKTMFFKKFAVNSNVNWTSSVTVLLQQ